jgi:hypothetical protein
VADERKYEGKTYTDATGKFAKGNPGKPQGARHKATVAVEALLQGEAERLGRQAVDAALNGDTAALRLCLDRIAPVRKDSPIQIAMPPIGNAYEASCAAAVILERVADGELTPSEGEAMMRLLSGFAQVCELADFEQRLAALEAASNKR